ncbi:MAG: hypothetical protein F4119_04965 [Acidimicrobiia bacterium]|nr:hypothetical protein [Acidimicrobiia bacterium]
MPGPSDQQMREYLDSGDFGGLFRRLGWDNPAEGLTKPIKVPIRVHIKKSVEASVEESIEKSVEETKAVAEKRGITVWVVTKAEIPPRLVQHQIVKATKRLSRDQLMVFSSPTEQLWLWP